MRYRDTVFTSLFRYYFTTFFSDFKIFCHYIKNPTESSLQLFIKKALKSPLTLPFNRYALVVILKT